MHYIVILGVLLKEHKGLFSKLPDKAAGGFEDSVESTPIVPLK